MAIFSLENISVHIQILALKQDSNSLLKEEESMTWVDAAFSQRKGHVICLPSSSGIPISYWILSTLLIPHRGN